MKDYKTQIENNFSGQIVSKGQLAGIESIRDGCQSLARLIDVKCPDGREKSLALTHLEETMFWADAAIARATEYDYDCG